MKSNTGYTAFPYTGHIEMDINGKEVDVPVSFPGMTLLDWFAGQAMDSVSRDNDGGTIKDAAAELGIPTADYSYKTHYPILMAKRAYKYAAAMVAEKRKREADNA